MPAKQTRNYTEMTEQAELYKQSSFSKITVVFLVLSALMLIFALATGSGFAAAMAFAQFALLITSRLMGMQRIRTKPFVRFIPAILALVLILPYYKGVTTYFGYTTADVMYAGSYQIDIGPIEWPTSEIASLVPVPPSETGHIYIDDTRRLNIRVADITKQQYRDYLAQCKQNGFTHEAEDESFYYDAFNADGYELNLTYYETDSQMTLVMNAPYEMTTLRWPKSGLATLLPVPDSQLGCNSSESADYYNVYVGDMSRDKFNDYVDACIDAGFNVDYSRYDKSFRADNADGVHLHVSYEGNSVVEIAIDKY